MEATIVFPNQLFRNHPHIDEDNPIYLVEEDTFFTKYRFHKKKLILHRASMKAFQDDLKRFEVVYVENEKKRTLENLFKLLKSHEITRMKLAEVLDSGLEENLAALSKKNSIELTVSGYPGFLTDQTIISDFFSSHGFNMTSFYIAQRKRLGILLENGKPVGGKWSYDPENRLKLPKGIEVPVPYSPPQGGHVSEAVDYVLDKFEDNPGSHQGFNYPIDRDEAEHALDDFIDKRLRLFGDYQDAISKRGSTLFHSLLSSSLNIGLITPHIVLKKVLLAHEKKGIPMNSLEGFIRQIIGWREYMRAVYLLKGRDMAGQNFWQNIKSLPVSFYKSITGIEPLDDTLRKVHETAYANHIERLMIIGNFCLLARFHPEEVYRWFMEMFIDAYEWVMVPNVYGMSQYSDGGSITSKPYVSSSSYIKRMSDYAEGEWSRVWDSLFWNFIEENREKIENIPRMKVMLYNLDRKPPDKMINYRKTAHDVIERLKTSSPA